MRSAEQARAIAAVRALSKTSMPSRKSDLCRAAPVLLKEVDPGYAAYVSMGYVSLVGSIVKVPVKILRDTCALDSFIVDSVLPFSLESGTGNSVVVRGLALLHFSVPKHKLMLFSDLVSGEVSMGIRPSLAMEGVHVILGNDLAGDRVWPVPSAPVVTSPPQLELGRGVASVCSDVFPACAVTRAMTKVKSGPHDSKSVHKGQILFPVPSFPLPLTHCDLVKEQREDSTLCDLFGG